MNPVRSCDRFGDPKISDKAESRFSQLTNLQVALSRFASNGMKKMFVAVLVLAATIVAATPASADEVVKVGINRLRFNIEDNEIKLDGWHIQFEHFMPKKVGIGLEFRKESDLLYEGFYIGPYLAYKSSSSPAYLFIHGGTEFGISSVSYNSYSIQYDPVKGYSVQRWVYLNRQGYQGVGVYPFADLGLGLTAKHLVLEGGVRVQVMRFGVQESIFVPNQEEAYSVRESKRFELVPSFMVQVGFKF